MRSSSYLLPWVLTRLLGFLSIGLTVACQPQSQPQSQPSSVQDSAVKPASPNPTQPSINLSPTTVPTPVSPTKKPSIVKTPTLPPKETSPQKTPKPNTIAKTPKTPSPKSPEKAITNKSTNIYQNLQMGIKFEYPEGYTIETSKERQAIDVWLSQDYQAIKSGKYQNTEPPSNLNISVEPNSQKLSAEEWVKANSDFLSPENFSNQAIAGKQTLTFRSSGLFEFEHFVIPTDDGKKMIIISIAEGDKKYQKVLEQVTSSLEFIN